MSVSIKPLEDRIVVQAVEAEQTTASGLVIPDTAKEKPQEGKVLAVGPGRFDDNGNRVPLDVNVGDVVIYSQVRRHRGQVRRRGVPHPLRPRRARHRREVSCTPAPRTRSRLAERGLSTPSGGSAPTAPGAQSVQTAP